MTGPRKNAAPAQSRTTVKLRNAVYKQAKMIVAHRGIDLSDYLSDLLEPLVQQDYQQMVAAIVRDNQKEE